MVTCRRCQLVDAQQSVFGGIHTSCDSQTRHEVVCKGPDGCLPLQRGPVCRDHAIDWNSHDEGDVKPVDMLVPIGAGNGLLGDVRFLGIVFLVAVWL